MLRGVSANGGGAVTLDDLPQSGATHGDVITWDSVSGAWEPDAPAGGGTPAWEWISESVPTTANAVVLTLPTGYDKFRIDMIGVEGASGVGLMVKLSQNGGTTYFDDTPDYAQHGTSQSGDTQTVFNLSSYSLFLTDSVETGTPVSAVLEFTAGDAGVAAIGTLQVLRYERTTGAFASRNCSWQVNTTTARCDRIKIMWSSSANFASGIGKVVLSGMTAR